MTNTPHRRRKGPKKRLPDMHRFSTYLTRDMHDAITYIADYEGVPITVFVRRALQAEIDRTCALYQQPEDNTT